MENKIKKIKINKSLQPLKRLRVAEAAHITLEASIYRLSNVGLPLINYIVDPQNSGLNWSLCRNIERSIATKLSVFFATSVVASCFLLRLVLWACSWIVLQHTLIMS